MALEQDASATFVEGTENSILEAEEVKITPPVRRKKAEKMKNKVGSKPLLRSEEVMRGDCCSNTLSVELSLKQAEDVECLNNDVPSRRDDTNFESHETKNGVLNVSCSDKDSANEARVEVLSCVENSSVKSNDLAAYANETNSVQGSNESEAVKEDFNLDRERKDDQEFPVGFEISRESCKSLDISVSASQDEESFVSADEAETSRELQSSTLNEPAETVNEAQSGGTLSVNSEITNTKKERATLDEGRCPETSQALITNCDQRSAFEVSKESLDSSSTAGLRESAKVTLSTEPSFIESSSSKDVSEPVIIDDQDSQSVDTDLGATGGVLESDSDTTDEEWSSSSYTSSEGEYDVSFAEVVRGLEEVSSLQVTG